MKTIFNDDLSHTNKPKYIRHDAVCFSCGQKFVYFMKSSICRSCMSETTRFWDLVEYYKQMIEFPAEITAPIDFNNKAHHKVKFEKEKHEN